LVTEILARLLLARSHALRVASLLTRFLPLLSASSRRRRPLRPPPTRVPSSPAGGGLMAGVGFGTTTGAGHPPAPLFARSAAVRLSAALRIPEGGGSGRSCKTRGRCSRGCWSQFGSGVSASRLLSVRRRGAPRVSSQRGEGRGGEGEGGAEWESRLVRTLLIDNYDSYTYNIYQELSVVNGLPPVVICNDEWTWEYVFQCLYEEEAFDNIVISPGPGSPTTLFFQLLQALGYVHGAQITYAPEPVHGRLSEIEHTGCNLFLDIPSGSKSGFKVVRYHSLIVDEDTLPKELIPIAWTTSEHAHSFLETETSARMPIFLTNSITQSLCADSSAKNVESSNMGREKVLMGIMHSTRPHYGVQFHPESIATSYGRKLFKNFKKMTIDYGLRSSALPERKVAFANEISRRLKVTKLSVANLLMGQHIVSSGIPKSKDPKYLKLQWRKFNGMAKQVGGSGNIFAKLFGDQNAEDTFWLDSSSTEQRRARFSFMGSKGGPLWKQMTFWLSDLSNKASKGGGYLSTRDADGEKKTIFLNDGFLDFLDKELQSFHYDKEDYQALPFDFCGGFVGYIGYGLKVECGASSNPHKSMVPDACFFFADNLLVIDHSNDDVYILSIHDAHCPRSRAAQHGTSEMKTWLDVTEKKLLGLVSSQEKMFIKHKLSTRPSNLSKPKFVVAKSRRQYMKDVESCLKFIQDGESYELCFTTQMKMRVKDIDALGIYCTLRDRNPAPYAAWLNFSKENLSILCSSPERFLQLDRNGILEAKPIKGTIARGATMEEDDHLKFQLQHSEKDQAENLMIVDLLRNDLGRVCEPGTVHVPHLMKVESYATVHTMVSTIRGEKIADLSPIDCVRAAFPGGSMTGAPKLRSMELLDTLECCSRGVYSGSIGFFSYNQRFDLNIVIRTVVIHEGEASIGAGGAVVALSSPEDEYEEMLLKARAPARVVEEYSKELGSENNLASSSFHSELCDREPLPLD
ncbi:hypothetical protein Taro_017702, partial [Colocasia esculenta]|nr:hypothetical protein [Colocasia esculenta]